MTHQFDVTARTWPLVRALARADGPKLTFHPWFLAGVAVALLGSGMFVNMALAGGSVAWNDDAWTVHAGFLLLAVFAMVACNAAALRDHREHTLEQHRALPASGPVRVTGLAGAVLWPATASMALLGSVSTIATVGLGVPGGTAGYVVHHGVLVVMMGTLGVALGVWVRNAFACPVVAFAFYLIHPGESPAAWHALWPFASLTSAPLQSVHILYLLGLTLVLLAVAQSRWGARREQVAVLVTGCAVTVASAVVLLAQVCPEPGQCGL
jgi:hypothetical protein